MGAREPVAEGSLLVAGDGRAVVFRVLHDPIRTEFGPHVFDVVAIGHVSRAAVVPLLDVVHVGCVHW